MPEQARNMWRAFRGNKTCSFWLPAAKVRGQEACLKVSLGCRDEKARLSKPCADEIFKTQLEAAADYRTDADLHIACEPDAKQICKDVKPGEGRIQDCLVRALCQQPHFKTLQYAYSLQENVKERLTDVRSTNLLLIKSQKERR